MNRKLCLGLFIALLVGICVCTYQTKGIEIGEVSGLTGNDFTGASMNVTEGTVTPKGLTVQIKGTKQTDGIFGDAYRLEVYQDKQWYELHAIIDGRVAWNAIGHLVFPGETRECRVDWTQVYGELSEGHYRIIKLIQMQGTDGRDQYDLTAEFTIT